MSWIVADGAQPDAMLDFRQNFIFSSFSPDANLTIWWMNMLMLASLAMFLPALVLLKTSTFNQGKRSLRGAFLLLAFSVLMATQLSKWIWILLPPLQRTQHPFRWLAVTSAIVPILLAASIPYWRSRFGGAGRPLALVAAGVVAISVTFTVGQTMRDANYLSRADFDQMLKPLRESPSINQWLPVWAASNAQGKASYEKTTPPRAAALADADGRSVSVISWQPEHREFFVDAGAPAELRVSTFYYPHWTASAENKKLSTRPAADGSLMISLPENATSVILNFQEPPRTRASAIVSALAWLLIGVLFVVQNKRARDRSGRETRAESLST
jgi:hypothetical protein